MRAVASLMIVLSVLVADCALWTSADPQARIKVLYTNEKCRQCPNLIAGREAQFR